MYNKKYILNEVNNIRKEIGHEITDVNIKKIIYNEKENELWIITEDRPDKSAIIGKGGWVVGKLRENLKINQIHVESYGDFLLKSFELELSQKRTSEFKEEFNGINNLNQVISDKIENIYNFNLNSYLENHKFEESETEAIVACSGGVDSSFSLILAKKLGFNPIAVTVDPGIIILPNQFKKNIIKLTEQLDVEHHYLKVDSSEIIQEALNGKYHPCGRCSKLIEETVYQYAIDNKIPLVIYGDMLSTGTQSITQQKEGLLRVNLPASLSCGKEEIKTLTKTYNLATFDGFGCPLLYEVHRKYPYLKKFSIQRILRETRAQALEPGEALDLIWSFYKI